MMNRIPLALAAILCNVLAQICMKYAGNSTQVSKLCGLFSLHTLAAVFFYGISFLLTIFVYADNRLSIASPVMAGVTFIFILLGSSFFFQEAITISKILGIVFILCGIFLLNK